MNSNTDKYYAEHAQEYFSQTVNADVSHLYKCFLSLLPNRGKILDVGCGSGRDMLEFVKLGYHVEGLDSSPTLSSMAEEYTGAKVFVGKIEDIALTRKYDGVWACASLLHIQRSSLPRALQNIRHALKPAGILFASLREGIGSSYREDGRFYEYYNEEELIQIVTKSGFVVDSLCKTKDVMPSRDKLTWLNLLAIRT